MSTRCQVQFFHEGTKLTDAPAAMVYHHSDGYPSYIVPLLRYLESVLTTPQGNGLGTRQDDPEYAAAEFVSQFRLPHDRKFEANPVDFDALNKERNAGLPEGLYRSQGNIYISQHLHGDIEFLYKIICKSGGWEIRIFDITDDVTTVEMAKLDFKVRNRKKRAT
jgi:hypothetical protein